MDDIMSNTDDLFKPEDLHPDLVPYLVTGEATGEPMLHHPLRIEVGYAPVRNRIINLNYQAAKARAEQARAEHEWSSYVFNHERPYRFDKFLEIVDEFTDDQDTEFWQLVGSIWTDSENIHEHFSEWLELWGSDRAGREAVMDAEEIAALEALPDPLTVFRGAGHKGVAGGLSWTTDVAKATWFARRYTFRGEGAYLAEGVVARRDVRAYFTGRNESEVVVLPTRVRDLRVKKLRARPR